MKVVRFKKNWDKYFGGEVAGFEDEQADLLIKGGVAELNAPQAKAPAAAAPSAPPAAGNGKAAGDKGKK